MSDHAADTNPFLFFLILSLAPAHFVVMVFTSRQFSKETRQFNSIERWHLTNMPCFYATCRF